MAASTRTSLVDDLLHSETIQIPRGTTLRLHYPTQMHENTIYMLGLRLSNSMDMQALWVPVITDVTDGPLKPDASIHNIRL